MDKFTRAKQKFCKHKDNLVLAATSPSGKKYWICRHCNYKTDWKIDENRPDNKTSEASK